MTVPMMWTSARRSWSMAASTSLRLAKFSRMTNSTPSERWPTSAASTNVPTGGVSKITYWKDSDSDLTKRAKRLEAMMSAGLGICGSESRK